MKSTEELESQELKQVLDLNCLTVEFDDNEEQRVCRTESLQQIINILFRLGKWYQIDVAAINNLYSIVCKEQEDDKQEEKCAKLRTILCDCMTVAYSGVLGFDADNQRFIKKYDLFTSVIKDLNAVIESEGFFGLGEEFSLSIRSQAQFFGNLLCLLNMESYLEQDRNDPSRFNKNKTAVYVSHCTKYDFIDLLPSGNTEGIKFLNELIPMAYQCQSALNLQYYIPDMAKFCEKVIIKHKNYLLPAICIKNYKLIKLAIECKNQQAYDLMKPVDHWEWQMGLYKYAISCVEKDYHEELRRLLASNTLSRKFMLRKESLYCYITDASSPEIKKNLENYAFLSKTMFNEIANGILNIGSMLTLLAIAICCIILSYNTYCFTYYLLDNYLPTFQISDDSIEGIFGLVCCMILHAAQLIISIVTPTLAFCYGCLGVLVRPLSITENQTTISDGIDDFIIKCMKLFSKCRKIDDDLDISADNFHF